MGRQKLNEYVVFTSAVMLANKDKKFTKVMNIGQDHVVDLTRVGLCYYIHIYTLYVVISSLSFSQ